MPPPLESWDFSDFPVKGIQDTLETFTFDKGAERRSRSLQDAPSTADAQPKRPSTLAEDLLRVKTNLERAMALDPSPRTIIPQTSEEIAQSLEVEAGCAPMSAGSRRSRASAVDDLPVDKTKIEATKSEDTSFAVATPDVIIESSLEVQLEAINSLEMEKKEGGTRTSPAGPSRDITPDIVKSKFEALEMFSRDVTPAASGLNASLARMEENGKVESLGDENAEIELDDQVRQKLQAVGAIAPPESEESETTNEEVASEAEFEWQDITMEDPHDEFLQSKLEAMGVIPRPSTPAFFSFSSATRTLSSVPTENEKDDATKTEVYDEFLQSKLEAMGVLLTRHSSSPDSSTSSPDHAQLKQSSESELDLTSAPTVTIDTVETTAQGDIAPPPSRPSSSTAVTGMGPQENTNDDAYLDIPSKRSSLDMSGEETPSITRGSSYSAFEDEPTEVRKESIVEIRAAELIHPLSRYDNYKRPLPISKERGVVREFLGIIGEEHNAEHAGHSFIEFDMDDFMICLPGTARHHPYEMTGLQFMHQMGHQEYLIDGIISLEGEEERYVEGIPFETLSIGSYGKDQQEVTGVWIQTRFNNNTDIHYRLRKPHRGYERFYTGFMWLANLAKNFVDYAMDCEEEEKKVSIHNFRRDFYDWCIAEHGDEAPFQKWYAQYGNPDFRTAIASNIDFLAKEAIGSWKLDFLDVFAEVKYLIKLPFHNAKQYKTIVTPFVYECFKEMPFGGFLNKVDPNADTDFRRKSIGEALHLSTDQDVIELDEEDGNDYEKTTARLAKRSLEDFKSRPFNKSSIAVGDVLAVVKDSGNVSKWKSEKTKWNEVDECWLMYVQSIEETEGGERAFRILWMYKPADTSCALMKYPYQDELFLSAHCECGQPDWITEDQVICRVSIAWNGSHGCEEDFFVRQRFHQHEMSFTTLKESDKKCEHMSFAATPAEEVQTNYEIGSTVLFQPKRTESEKYQRLEPGEILSFNEDETVTVRRLLRRSSVQPESNAKANELVYTDLHIPIQAAQIHHECQVRFYSTQEVREKTVPPPYSLNGACDFFYICTRQIETVLPGAAQRLEDIDPANPPSSLIQGFDPKAPPPKNPMRGLDLFCGGGNMGRGLEDGGAVRFTHACDYQDNAIASYYANTENTEHTKFFAGSVNDLLKYAMDGNPNNISGVPLPGDIEFISAGSPCQGFSNMNPNKNNDEALRNQSLVADVASMVEFYRPKYAVLENVVAMSKKGHKRSEDCLSQLICCLVGMGYQLQVNLLDAWSFGCPQSRKRLFVVVAAPDLAMPKPPNSSHSHPESTGNVSLGMMANGLPIGRRTWTDTAFKYQSAEEATADLPDIGDGQTYHCTPFPDHRASFNMKELFRKQLAAIPLFPPGMNAQLAWPRMSEYERSLFSVRDAKTKLMKEKTAAELQKSFQRVKAGELFPTITTACAPTEKFNGKVGHWSQQRVISILEAKRAQGFLDSDVLVGSRRDQYKIVGNSVARPVAIAEGMALRKAWLQNEDDNPSLDAALVPITVRDDVAHLDLPSAPSSKGSEFAFRRGIKGLISSNSGLEDDSSVSSAPPRRRESHFSVVIPARNSIVEFPSSPASNDNNEEPTQQSLRYVRRATSPLSALPCTPAWPGEQGPAASKTTVSVDDEDVEMRDAPSARRRRQDFEQLPQIRPGMAEAKRSAKKRRRMMGGVTPGSSRAASESPAPAANLGRADASIVQASQRLAHLDRRRSQGPSRAGTPGQAQSRFATPSSRPSSRLSQGPTETGLSKKDKSIAQAAQQMIGIGRRRSQTASQQVSRATTPHPHDDEDDEAPRTAKRRKLPSKPVVSGSVERPISLDDSEDEVAAIAPTPRIAHERARTHTPAAKAPDEGTAELVARAMTPQPRSGGWTAVNTHQSAGTVMEQLPLVGRHSAHPSPSPIPSRMSRQVTPRPRQKKAKKPREPFVIDLTADDDIPSSANRGRVARREIQPYQPVDNSAWMSMMLTKSMNGGLGGANVESLLGMDMVDEESAFGDVEAVRRLGSGENGGEGEKQERMEEEVQREVVYGY